MKKIALLIRFLLLSLLIAAFVSCPVLPPELDTTFQIRFKNSMGAPVYITIGSDSGGGYFEPAIEHIPMVGNGSTSSYYSGEEGNYKTYISYDGVYFYKSPSTYSYRGGKRYLNTVYPSGYNVTEE